MLDLERALSCILIINRTLEVNMTEMTIQQAAEKTGLSVHTLRYYERIGLTSPVSRASNGHRRYSEDDVYGIVFLTRLRATGMPISEIKRYTELAQQGESTTHERLALLEAHRDAVKKQLEEVSRHLMMIENKIRHYQEYYKAQLSAQEEALKEEPYGEKVS
jgi:DNA-binding transcriptional MerR regulator